MVFSFPTFLKRILTFNTINCDVMINFDALNFQNEVYHDVTIPASS